MTSEPFKTPASTYLKITMMLWMARRGWLMLLPLIALIIITISTADARWAIVSLAYLMICVPMILMPIVLSHMLSLGARRQLSLKRVDYHPGSDMLITYYNDEVEREDSEIILAKDIKDAFHIGSITVVRLRSKKIEIIIIPDN